MTAENEAQNETQTELQNDPIFSLLQTEQSPFFVALNV